MVAALLHLILPSWMLPEGLALLCLHWIRLRLYLLLKLIPKGNIYVIDLIIKSLSTWLIFFFQKLIVLHIMILVFWLSLLVKEQIENIFLVGHFFLTSSILLATASYIWMYDSFQNLFSGLTCPIQDLIIWGSLHLFILDPLPVRSFLLLSLILIHMIVEPFLLSSLHT